jgi:hypothetical protein
MTQTENAWGRCIAKMRPDLQRRCNQVATTHLTRTVISNPGVFTDARNAVDKCTTCSQAFALEGASALQAADAALLSTYRVANRKRPGFIPSG